MICLLDFTTHLKVRHEGQFRSFYPLSKCSRLTETGDPTQYLSPRFFLVIDRQRKDNDSVSCALTGQEELNSLCLPLETKLSSSTNTCASIPFTGPEVNSERQIVEIPLSYDAQFFDMVRLKLRALENLQLQQENEMSHNIQQLALQVTNDIQQPSPKSKSLIYTWREIFHLYTGFQVFFSTEERDGGQRSAASACQRFSNFEEALTKSHLARKLNKRGRHTLELFISFNKVLLRNIKFLEINAIALRKILKKFDKHTALHARPAFLNLVRPDIPTPENTAKSVCCVMSKDLIGLVPQLDDYLCPICFAIAFKPVRLRCGHVFCIRCLVVMQQRKQSHCALCRDESVLDATGGK